MVQPVNLQLHADRYKMDTEIWDDRRKDAHKTAGILKWFLPPPANVDWSAANFFELYAEDNSPKTIFQLARHVGFGRETELEPKREFPSLNKSITSSLIEQIRKGELLSVIIATSSVWLREEYLKLGYYGPDAFDINFFEEYTAQRSLCDYDK